MKWLADNFVQPTYDAHHGQARVILLLPIRGEWVKQEVGEHVRPRWGDVDAGEKAFELVGPTLTLNYLVTISPQSATQLTVTVTSVECGTGSTSSRGWTLDLSHKDIRVIGVNLE